MGRLWDPENGEYPTYRASAPSYWCICPPQTPAIPSICKNIIERGGVTRCFQTESGWEHTGQGLSPLPQCYPTALGLQVPAPGDKLLRLNGHKGTVFRRWEWLLSIEQLQTCSDLLFNVFAVIMCCDKNKRDFMNKSGFLEEAKVRRLEIKKKIDSDAYKRKFSSHRFCCLQKQLEFNFYLPTSMPEVKGNYVQFPKHVLWLYQLKSQWLKWKMKPWVHTGHIPPKQHGNAKQQTVMLLLPDFVEHKTKP